MLSSILINFEVTTFDTQKENFLLKLDSSFLELLDKNVIVLVLHLVSAFLLIFVFYVIIHSIFAPEFLQPPSKPLHELSDFNINQIWRAWCQTIGKWGQESQFLCQFQEIFIEKSKVVLKKSVKIMAEVKAKVTKVMKLYFSQINREPSKNITLCKYFLSKNPKIWVIVQNT